MKVVNKINKIKILTFSFSKLTNKKYFWSKILQKLDKTAKCKKDKELWIISMSNYWIKIKFVKVKYDNNHFYKF